tara:strand:- start:1677 stop:2630 length:954 start_codon:yes stop_codon:yes gene_type:complete
LKILVTGAAGFIGYHLSNRLLKSNYYILGIDSLNNYYSQKLKKDRIAILNKFNNFSFKEIDISKKERVDNLFREFNPSIVVNLAAQVGVRYSLENPYDYLNSNLNGFLNILESCRTFGVDGLIYASSSSIYGDNKNKPFSVNDKSDKPVSFYGATKKANEVMAHSYSHLYDLNTTGLRFFTVYGPWYRPDMAINIFTEKICKNQPLNVFNNGKMRRDFTYVDDIVDGICRAIEKNYRFEIFNLGNSKSENIMDVIKQIEKSLDKRALINYQPMQPGDVYETFADISRSTDKLGYKPKVNIDKGIQKFVNWYREYYDV